MTLVFNRDFEPRTGEAVAVAPGVRRVTAGNPGPFTFGGTNTFLIGEGQLAVLDPGPDDPTHLEALFRAVGDAEVVAILVTHTHRDHSPAARPLQRRFPAPIYAASAHRPSRPLRAGESWLDAGGDLDFVPDRILGAGDFVAVGALRLETVPTPGHTANHLAYALSGRDLLFSGDHVMGWSSTIVAPPDGSMAAYMASLDALLDRPERLYLPAHGPAIPDAQAYVRALRDHRRMREAAIVAELRRGASDIPKLVERIYRDLDPLLAAAAALSLFAHLEDLVAREIVRTEGAPSLDGSYRLTEATPDAAAPGSG